MPKYNPITKTFDCSSKVKDAKDKGWKKDKITNLLNNTSYTPSAIHKIKEYLENELGKSVSVEKASKSFQIIHPEYLDTKHEKEYAENKQFNNCLKINGKYYQFWEKGAWYILGERGYAMNPRYSFTGK